MLSTAQMMVLITRGFDLSVGNVISMISVASSAAMVWVLGNHPEAHWLAILVGWIVGLAVGLMVGAVNGFNVAILRVNPFVATLGMLSIALGVASTLTGGFTVMNLPEAFTNTFSRGSWVGIPTVIWVCVVVLAMTHFLLDYTTMGRSLYLLGSGPRAAHVAGLSTRLHLFSAYVVCSLIVAVVALMMTARTGTGEPNLGGGLMFASLTAAVIGGVSLFGGEGGVLNCVVGSLFVTILSNGMNMIRFSGYYQEISLGAVLIAAVFLDGLRSRIR
jgi:ribose transport system permease protein